jgi:hypothetical protein
MEKRIRQITILTQPFQARSSFEYYLKIQFLPQRKHNAPPSQTSVG